MTRQRSRQSDTGQIGEINAGTDSHGIKATIFTPGRICELYPRAVKTASEHGHEIADHMWEHQVPKDPELERDHLRKACALVWCNTAPAERATEAMDTFRSLATPMLDGVGEMPFPALQSAFDPLLPFGTRMYWRGGFVNEVPDAAIAEYKRFGESAPVDGEPSIERWAATVSQLLKPGGRLFMREGHPILWALCNPRPDELLVLEYPYFETADGTEFIETKELKDPLAIEVEDPQIISLVQIAFDRLKMPAIALLGERQWNLKRDELADAFLLEHLKELLIA